MAKALAAQGIKVVADISTDPGQIDFSAVVLQIKQANPDVLFAYLTEEEGARLLRELKKQGFNKPIVGETAIIGQKVIDKAATEKIGKFDSKALAAALHGAKISTKETPGVLLDVSFDQNGDLDRESFIIKVVNGKQQVVATVPAVGAAK